jgi:hypothetical protein
VAIPASAQILILSRPGPQSTAGSSTSLSAGVPDASIKLEYKSEQIKKHPLIKSCKTHKQIAQLLINSASLFYLVYSSGNYLVTTLLDNTSHPLSILELSSKITSIDATPTISESGAISILLGTSTGEVILYDPIATTRSVYSKAVQAAKCGAVTCVKWVPWIETQFSARFVLAYTYLKLVLRMDQSLLLILRKMMYYSLRSYQHPTLVDSV